MFTHHLIRDFMFTDATYHNKSASGPSQEYQPPSSRQYTVEPRDLIPSDHAAEDSKLGQYTRGTYTKDTQAVSSKFHVLLDDIHSKKTLSFTSVSDLSYTAKYYQLTTLDGNEVNDIDHAPNWFGVAVPDGCKDFSNVIIYFHPGPTQPGSGWNDKDYPARNGANGGSNWKELFGYVDRLGTQLAAAIKAYGATPNQIVIVPFMPNALCNVNIGGRIGSAGILPDQWYYIVNDIIKDLARQ